MTITRKQIVHLAAGDRLDRRINGPGNPGWTGGSMGQVIRTVIQNMIQVAFWSVRMGWLMGKRSGWELPPYPVRVFPQYTKLAKLTFFVQLLMGINWEWLPAKTNSNTNLHLSYCSEIKCMWLITKSNLFSNLSNIKMSTLPTLCITRKLEWVRSVWPRGRIRTAHACESEIGKNTSQK